MRSTCIAKARIGAAAVSHGSRTQSWLPLHPDLIVSLDPARWSARARVDERWQRREPRPDRKA